MCLALWSPPNVSSPNWLFFSSFYSKENEVCVTESVTLFATYLTLVPGECQCIYIVLAKKKMSKCCLHKCFIPFNILNLNDFNLIQMPIYCGSLIYITSFCVANTWEIFISNWQAICMSRTQELKHCECYSQSLSH